MSPRQLRVSFSLAGVFATSAFGDVIVVPSGSPANAIATAVAAAVDGDLILVQAGDYSGFVINGKGISVVADARTNVHITDEIGVINVPDASPRALADEQASAGRSTSVDRQMWLLEGRNACDRGDAECTDRECNTN